MVANFFRVRESTDVDELSRLLRHGGMRQGGGRLGGIHCILERLARHQRPPALEPEKVGGEW